MSRNNRNKLLEFRKKKSLETLDRPQESVHLRPKKQLGQNFLNDPNIRRKIIEAAGLKKNEIVLEIGAGLGAMTSEISPLVEKVLAVETDRRYCEVLRENFKGSNVEIIEADFLKLDLNIVPEGTKVLGNLPYYITSPILEKLLAHKNKFHEVYLTVQWEFGRRMVARINTKEYSALSCFIQYHSHPELLFRIKAASFQPAPKVDSCLIKLKNPVPTHPFHDERLLFQVIHMAFAQRRKTILNSLAGLVNKGELSQILKKANIDASARAENLTTDQYIQLAHEIHKSR